MTSKSEYTPKSVKTYDLDEFEKILKGVKVATCMLVEPHQVDDDQSVIKQVKALTIGGNSIGVQCSCCGAGPFETRGQQTAHYKHHWHTYNLKRRLFGKTSLTLAEFNARQDDNSSVSGSDSETEDTTKSPATDLFVAATRHCKGFFTNKAGQVFCIYRCLLHHRKEDLSTDGAGKYWVDRCQRLSYPGYQRWAVFMISGGHFAGAIFSGSVPIVHKSMHSYVVRRGQGQAQAARDMHGVAPKSAGATLRRHNQQQFLLNVQQVIASWAEDLKECSLILYRAVGPTNQATLFGKATPLRRDDMRVRSLPFPTRKPTFKEVKRAHEILANIEVYDTKEIFQKALISSQAKAPAKPGSDGSGTDRPGRKPQKSPLKLDRAKSREPIPRELPTQVTSSEDEGPCYIDSETPADWIQTLAKHPLTNSRKDLLLDHSVGSPESSESEGGPTEQMQREKKKKKKKKEDVKEVKKPFKIPANVKKLWKTIVEGEQRSLTPILEGWEGAPSMDLASACNLKDPNDGNTALHKASIALKPEMVTEILTAGGDPCVKNNQQQTPYAASANPDIRVAFRMFQAQHPDKYNYAKSQIPGPLTPEQLEQEKERKAAQKKAKRQRDKEKQVEKIKANKFLQLTDNQKLRNGGDRCFFCGVQLPVPPFEYEKFRFCTIKCLQHHKNLRPINMPVF